jgi:hypothetical protein
MNPADRARRATGVALEAWTRRSSRRSSVRQPSNPLLDDARHDRDGDRLTTDRVDAQTTNAESRNDASTALDEQLETNIGNRLPVTECAAQLGHRQPTACKPSDNKKDNLQHKQSQQRPRGQ